MAFDDPITLALLGASSGFLDPRGGMSGGFHGALQGLQAGHEIQRQNLLAQRQDQQLMRDMEARQLLSDTIARQQESGKTDLRSLGNALIATGHPDLIKHGIEFNKGAPKVKTTTKVMRDGQAFAQPIFDTGEFGELSQLPAAEKLMQINQGSQVGLANPFTGQIQSAVGVGMSPGESARLAQSQQQFNQSQGLAQQRLALDQARAAMEFSPEFQATKQGNIAAAKESAKLRETAKNAVHAAIPMAAETLNLSNDLREHPMLEEMTGTSRLVHDRLAALGGNPQADFLAKHNQATGRQFLSGIEFMRGFGQLTQIEGQTAQQAVAEMDRSTDAESYKKASQKYDAAIRAGIRKIAGQAGIPEDELLNRLSNEQKRLRTDASSGDGWGELR